MGLERSRVKKILTWIQLAQLLLHYFNHLVVSRIAGHVGKSIRVDVATIVGERARYARGCMEIDLWQPLLGYMSSIEISTNLSSKDS
ncbi:hypothetical protein LINGRAHAP2_LOCUS24908 [Linum grandiflorum]